MDINIRFESNENRIEVGKGKPFRLLSIEGIETGTNELAISGTVFGDGSVINNRRITAKPIVVEAEYVGKNKVEERRNLIKFFNIHNEDTLFVKVGDNERCIDYEVESFHAPIRNVNDPLRFLVYLYCPIPFFRDLTEKKEEVAVWHPSLIFPLVMPAEGISMGYREPSISVNVFNDGDNKTGMRIEFKALGSLANPSLLNVNTREYFKINREMKAGETIIVDTNYKKKRVEIERNGRIEKFTDWDISSTFLELDIGDNLFRYDADNNIENLEVSIYYNPQYLGV